MDCEHWYLNTTDCGSDQTKCNKLAAVAVADYENMFWLWSPCFEHQNHLIVGGGLRLTDKLLKQRGAKWKYFRPWQKCVIFGATMPKMCTSSG